jgi:hypothetical protein
LFIRRCFSNSSMCRENRSHKCSAHRLMYTSQPPNLRHLPHTWQLSRNEAVVGSGYGRRGRNAGGHIDYLHQSEQNRVLFDICQRLQHGSGRRSVNQTLDSVAVLWFQNRSDELRAEQARIWHFLKRIILSYTLSLVNSIGENWQVLFSSSETSRISAARWREG